MKSVTVVLAFSLSCLLPAGACEPLGSQRSAIDEFSFSPRARLFAVRETFVEDQRDETRVTWRIYGDSDFSRPLLDAVFYDSGAPIGGVWRQALPSSFAYSTLTQLDQALASYAGRRSPCRRSSQAFACEQAFHDQLKSQFGFSPMASRAQCSMRIEWDPPRLVLSGKQGDQESGDADLPAAEGSQRVVVQAASCFADADGIQAVLIRSEGVLGVSESPDEASEQPMLETLRFRRETVVRWNPVDAEARRLRLQAEKAEKNGGRGVFAAWNKALAAAPHSPGTALRVASIIAQSGQSFADGAAVLDTARWGAYARTNYLERLESGADFAAWQNDAGFQKWLAGLKGEISFAAPDEPRRASDDDIYAASDIRDGRLRCATGDFSGALKSFRSAVEHAPAAWEPRMEAASAAASLSDADQAVALAKSAADINAGGARRWADADPALDELAGTPAFKAIFRSARRSDGRSPK
jgi:hypothetical protein